MPDRRSERTRLFAGEVAAPSVATVESFKQALEAFLPEFGRQAEQARRELELLELADLREEPEMRSQLEQSRQRITASLRLHAEITQRLRAFVQARELLATLAPKEDG